MSKLVLAVSLAALFALSTAGAALGKTYFGKVGPGRTITFENANGNRVTRIRAGTHTIKVRDRSSMHNFHLLGRGIDRRTRVPFVGRRTWTLTFSEGFYRYRCDPHRRHMKGSFRAV